MKNKTKLALAASVLSCTAFAGLGSATFAWFVTQNNVVVQHTNLTIASANPNMTLYLSRLIPASDGSTPVTSTETISESIQVSDISSKFGQRFFAQATMGSNPYSEHSASILGGRVLQYGIKVVTMGMSRALDLKITPAITAGSDSASTSAKSWVRTAVYECTDETYANAQSEGSAYAFMLSKTQDGCDQYVDGPTTSGLKTYQDGELYNYGTAAVLKEGIKDAHTSYYKISIWMEGTAATNQNAARGATFGISTTFSLA